MKKLVILSPSQIEYVKELAKELKSPNAKFGDFSKALREIIDEHKLRNVNY